MRELPRLLIRHLRRQRHHSERGGIVRQVRICEPDILVAGRRLPPCLAPGERRGAIEMGKLGVCRASFYRILEAATAK